MPPFPDGTVTLLFTDVDHSTDLVKRLQEKYGETLARHRELLRSAFDSHGGVEVDTQGDAFFVTFRHARAAVEAAVAAQRLLAEERWPHEARVAVRMGLHTGEPYLSDHGYTGVAVHRAARICTVAHGGQVLLSRATAGIVDDDELPDIQLRDLGEHALKDFERPERLFQLVIAGLQSHFPPLRAVVQQPSLVGTVTILLAEGRRMLRLMHELPPEQFGALITDYRRLLPAVLEEHAGQQVDVAGDSVSAAFASPKGAAVAAVAIQRAMGRTGCSHRSASGCIRVRPASGGPGRQWFGARNCAMSQKAGRRSYRS